MRVGRNRHPGCDRDHLPFIPVIEIEFNGQKQRFV
jgi:hypothetical protein